jgi:hypothetical protein
MNNIIEPEDFYKLDTDQLSVDDEEVARIATYPDGTQMIVKRQGLALLHSCNKTSMQNNQFKQLPWFMRLLPKFIRCYIANRKEERQLRDAYASLESTRKIIGRKWLADKLRSNA